MSEWRKDAVTGRWVIIATDRSRRPSDFLMQKAAAAGREHCPFCPGRERMTPPEVLAYREHGSVPDGPGWYLRVVPNKFPALEANGELVRESEGVFERMEGIGVHDVIIETPDHDKTLATMSSQEIGRLLRAFRERASILRADGRFRYVVLFKNHGATAGATLEHPHAQLIALPIVPGFVRDELEGSKRYYDAVGRCVFCDLIRQERLAATRVVDENADVIALAPFASRFPFETWVLPKLHSARFEESPDLQLGGMTDLLRSVAGRLDRALGRPDYNLIVHTSPFGEDTHAFYHWHVEIIPKLSRTAGFEWGTGFYINHTLPEDAAEALRTSA